VPRTPEVAAHPPGPRDRGELRYAGRPNSPHNHRAPAPWQTPVRWARRAEWRSGGFPGPRTVVAEHDRARHPPAVTQAGSRTPFIPHSQPRPTWRKISRPPALSHRSHDSADARLISTPTPSRDPTKPNPAPGATGSRSLPTDAAQTTNNSRKRPNSPHNRGTPASWRVTARTAPKLATKPPRQGIVANYGAQRTQNPRALVPARAVANYGAQRTQNPRALVPARAVAIHDAQRTQNPRAAVGPGCRDSGAGRLCA
jgi:hypothetical protein